METGLTKDEKRLEAPDFTLRTDRVGKYLEKLGAEFVFDEFQSGYLKREKLTDIMQGVPIPLRHQDVVDFHGSEGLSVSRIVENMARVMGINPQFQYVSAYKSYIGRYYSEKLADALVKEGRDEAEGARYEAAAVHFRGALVLSPDNMHAIYSYARVCRELYLAEEGGDPGYIGQFKAESMEYFELCTELYPTFAEAWYFLGYAYLNLGLYLKTTLAWKEFLRYSKNSKDKKEIRQRLEQLTDPVKIEAGCNHILAGRWGEGIDGLLPYRGTQYEDWWPLHYYLGTGYARIGEEEDAIDCFKRTLTLAPSQCQSMEELSALYEKRGETALAEKYRKKLAIVRE